MKKKNKTANYYMFIFYHWQDEQNLCQLLPQGVSLNNVKKSNLPLIQLVPLKLIVSAGPDHMQKKKKEK